ncbi:MAG: TonB-dependent receptor [Rhodospirillaceae bacterium]|nr:TonB-dependent receptor [Rhodospirillaceae bacterium]
MKHATARGFWAACLATTAIVGIVPTAFAQIEEIVVTTRKRAENLQDIPIVVTAFTAENLERKGISNLADVLKFTPGVQLVEAFAPSDQRIIIRGLSPTRGRPNVAVLQDDIDVSSEALQNAGGSLLINPRLFDIERIEIVKGPHSALFGRSAFAGALNYITKKPGEEFEGKVNVEAGLRGKAEVKISTSGPIQDTGLSVGFNAAYWTFDGFHHNSLTGERLGGSDGKGIAGAAVYRGSDTFKATLRAEYTNDDADPLPRVIIRSSFNETVPVTARTDVPAAAGGTPGRGLNISPAITTFPIFVGAIPDFKASGVPVVSSPNPRTGKDYPGVRREIYRFTSRLDGEFSMVNVSLLSHYGHGDTQQFFDGQQTGNVATARAYAEVNQSTLTKLHTQELRFQSNDDDSRLRWTVGGLYWNEEVEQLSNSATCFTSVPARGAGPLTALGNPADTCGPYIQAFGTTRPYINEFWGRNTFHSSTYALVDFDITEQFTINGEIRRTWEREKVQGPNPALPLRGIDPYGILNGPPLTGAFFCGFGAPPANPACFAPVAGAPIAEKSRQSFWVPRIGLNFKVNDDVLTYISAAKGVKPAGISTVGGGNAPLVRANLEYDAEKMWVYEGGVKSTWLDGKAQVNAALYYQDFSDKQASTQIVLPTGILGTRIVNAASARVWGVDLETAFAPTEQLNFSVGYTWLDAKYKDFVVRTGGANPIVRSQSCIPVVTYRLTDGTSRTVVNPTALPAAGAVITARTCDVDKSGHKLELAPTHALQFNTLFKSDIGGDMTWISELSVQAQSKRWNDDDQRSYLAGFVTMDVRTGVESDNWTVTAYVDNVLNDDTIKQAFANTDFNSLAIQFAPPPLTVILANQITANAPDKRQFGVRASYKF